MLSAVRDRWANRRVRCLKCQKKLVANEKWVCKECREQLTWDALLGLILGFSSIAAVNSHNKDSKD